MGVSHFLQSITVCHLVFPTQTCDHAKNGTYKKQNEGNDHLAAFASIKPIILSQEDGEDGHGQGD